jgi:hypothetical protein
MTDFNRTMQSLSFEYGDGGKRMPKGGIFT